MDPISKAKINTLLKYTYRANVGFFAAFASWYVINGRREQEAPIREEKKTAKGDHRSV